MSFYRFKNSIFDISEVIAVVDTGTHIGVNLSCGGSFTITIGPEDQEEVDKLKRAVKDIIDWRTKNGLSAMVPGVVELTQSAPCGNPPIMCGIEKPHRCGLEE